MTPRSLLVPSLALASVLLVGCQPPERSSATAPELPPVAAQPTENPGEPVPGARPHHRGLSWVGGPQVVTAEDFDRAVAVGADWIVQTPFGWQRGVTSTDIGMATSGQVWWGERDEGLEVTTRLARERGIETLLKPHIWLTGGGGTGDAWRGEIAMESDDDWRTWFDNYTVFALHYARLAERLEIPVYAIGTELHATARERPDDWRRLIREIRQVYSGELTYAANWYDEIEDVTFWDELDYIGVQAYFPLSDEEHPTLEKLLAGWEPHVAQLEALHERTGKPVLFTEVGYTSRPGAATDPWTWPEHRLVFRQEATTEGLELQARAYEAFFRTFWHRSWFAGAYVWKWFPDQFLEGGEVAPSVGFTPQGKPAEEVLRRWYDTDATAD